MFIRSKSFIAPLALVAASMIVACGSDSTSSPSTSPAVPATTATPTTTPPTTAPPPAQTTTTPPTTASPPAQTSTAPPTTSGGGSAQAGAPVFDSFTVTSPATCSNGNAEVTMAYTTRNAVSIDIKIGNGSFASTAGYGPNETGVIASVPCSGAGTSTVQLKACTENNTCTTSELQTVEIKG
jgi:hypothetical protein